MSGMYESPKRSKEVSSLMRAGATIVESNVTPIYFHSKERKTNNNNTSPFSGYPRIVQASSNSSSLINRLTLKRLRKMQALVRGFITRRVTYPRLMKQYRLCQRVYEMICGGCLLTESSSIVLDILASNRVEKEFQMESRKERTLQSLAETLICNTVEEMSKELIATCISEQIQKKTPLIKTLTAGTSVNHYRLHIPEQLVFYQLFATYLDRIKYNFARQIIDEVVQELRFEKIVEEYIMDQKIVKPFVEEIVKGEIQGVCRGEVGEEIIDTTVGQFVKALVGYEMKRWRLEEESGRVQKVKEAVVDMLVGEVLLEMINGDSFQ